MANYKYQNRLNNLRARRSDQEVIKSAALADKMRMAREAYDSLNETENIKYVIGAMTPVDNVYTAVTIREGERVKNHISKLNAPNCYIEFRFQGSVTNNTHIKAHSDIDLLTIHNGFISLEPPNKATSPYGGDPVQELVQLRKVSYEILKAAFPAASVDDSGAKAISLEGGSLRRKVDVVIANWYHTNAFIAHNIDFYKGVNVLDFKNKIRIKNTPFYHNELLKDKDSRTMGSYKRVVRLLKTLKADADIDIKISSYDIAALIYHMEDQQLWVGSSPLMLVDRSINYLRRIVSDNLKQQTMLVPDGSRKIFCDQGTNAGELLKLIRELEAVYADMLNDLASTRAQISKIINL